MSTGFATARARNVAIARGLRDLAEVDRARLVGHADGLLEIAAGARRDECERDLGSIEPFTVLVAQPVERFVKRPVAAHHRDDVRVRAHESPHDFRRMPRSFGAMHLHVEPGRREFTRYVAERLRSATGTRSRVHHQIDTSLHGQAG